MTTPAPSQQPEELGTKRRRFSLYDRQEPHHRGKGVLEIATLLGEEQCLTIKFPQLPHHTFCGDRAHDSFDPRWAEEPLACAGKHKVREENYKSHLDTLLRVIAQFLERGEINKAANAFGVVLQLRPRSEALDLRQHNMWAIGAEILMRQGEEVDQEQTQTSHSGILVDNVNYQVSGSGTKASTTSLQQWGSGANMSKVKAYFENLIRQFPYNPRSPNRVSAIDFWFAMLQCELYSAHVEYTTGLTRINRLCNDSNGIQSNSEDAVTPHLGGETHYDAELGSLRNKSTTNIIDRSRADRSRRLTGKLREKTLGTVRDITLRLDKLLEQPHYAKDVNFLRLRTTSSLFAAELSLALMVLSPP